MTPSPSSRSIPLLLAVAAVTAFALASWAELDEVPYGGYWTDGDNTVMRVMEGSPAAEAGLKRGDYILDIDGVPMEDMRARQERGRPAIGETRVLTVEREGEVRQVAITYGAVPEHEMALGRTAVAISLSFVLCGVLPYLWRPGRSTRVLAVTGVCLALAFVEGPYLESPDLRRLVAAVQHLAIVVGFAALLHFMLAFPRPKPLLERRAVRGLIYVPALLVGGLIVFLYAFQPDATSGLNVFLRGLFSLFVVGYFALSAFAMLHSYVSATPTERSAAGLNILLVGTIAGLVPVTISRITFAIAPTYVLPGVEYWFLTMGLIPVSLAAAVWIRERHRSRGLPATVDQSPPVSS